ncbi:MAG: sodium/glutamate symporter [Pirellulales bacterium]
MVDFSLIAVLIVAAHLLRARLPWASRYLVPTSMIAGVLGLLGGPDLLGFLPFSQLDAESGGALRISQYPGVLVTFVFATLLLGHRPAHNRTRLANPGVRVSLLYNTAGEFGQWGLAILFGALVLAVVFPGLPENFAVMLPAGFAGGHGTAAIFGPPFQTQGWQEALSVGFAFATLGLMASIFGGMLIINFAVRRGWTQFIGRDADIESDKSPPFLEGEEQFSIGTATVNPVALDPLAWHVALLGLVYGATRLIDYGTHKAMPGEYWIPQFAVAMLLGAALQYLLDCVGLGVYVDRNTMRRLGSMCADALVVCGIASIKLSVVWQYATPMAIMAAFGLVYSVAYLYVGRWIFPKNWFEQSIFTYGWMTGVVGFAVALLRVVDPRLKSDTLEEFGVAYMVLGPLEMILYPTIIWACLAGLYVPLGIVLSLAAGGMLFAARVAARPLNASTFESHLTPERVDGQTISPI